VAVPITFTVTVTPNTIPTFAFGTTLNICTGGTVPVLVPTSDNGIDGTWSPAIVDNQASAVYTFTPVVPAGQCIIPTIFTVTVNPILTPAFNLGSLTICEGSTAPVLPTTSVNGVTGTWSPAVVSNTSSGTYTFTTSIGQCADPSATINITVVPKANISTVTSDTTVTDGTVIAANILNGTPSGITYTWTNSNTAIGLGTSGTGNITSFTATNKGATDITSIITITPMNNGCAGIARTYEITVKPLNKDIFVPNVFSPNGDGKNDILYIYGNYIQKVEMRIFNQWGEQVDIITTQSKGWDGKHQGKPQPVGVYVYGLEATMTDGRKVRLKGNITLIR
jgi:gliding motility-associated-like protein